MTDQNKSTELDLKAIRTRDTASADTWFREPALGGCGRAFIDRRALLQAFDVSQLELDTALMQLQGLKDLLSQAVDDIESWSGYASTYFHEKHDLKGCLARYRAALDVPAEPLCDHGIPVNSPSACPTCHSEQPTRPAPNNSPTGE